MSKPAPQSAPQGPFRFLDLRKELRVMVYERIPIEVKTNAIPESKQPRFTVVFASTSVSILATCRQVQAESQEIIQQKLAKLDTIPLRLYTGSGPLRGLSSVDGFLMSLSAYMRRHGQPLMVSAELWTYEDLLGFLDLGRLSHGFFGSIPLSKEKIRAKTYMLKLLCRYSRSYATSSPLAMIEIGICSDEGGH